MRTCQQLTSAWLPAANNCIAVVTVEVFPLGQQLFNAPWHFGKVALQSTLLCISDHTSVCMRQPAPAHFGTTGKGSKVCFLHVHMGVGPVTWLREAHGEWVGMD